MTVFGNIDLRARLLDRRQRLQLAMAEFKETSQVMRLLHEVDSALERMDKGSYGVCEVCHGEIEPERLFADPLARNCLDCLTPIQQRALEQDLDLASRIQTQLLPNKNLSFAGWEAYYHYEVAGTLSGDFCDLTSSEAGNGDVFFVIGDVSGKGVAASMLMAHLHAIFRSLVAVGLSVPQLVERANRIFCESTMSADYATLVCGKASQSGEVEICNAGHCMPLVVGGSGIRELEATGFPVGIFCSGEYSQEKVRLAAGDTLLLYTDGFIEGRNSSDVEYGMERLTGLVKSHHGLRPQKLTEVCLNDLTAFMSGAPKTDDLTIMAIQRTG
jgi:sigma-B regulation protein RsbU (phosphoserine phosphatase)